MKRLSVLAAAALVLFSCGTDEQSPEAQATLKVALGAQTVSAAHSSIEGSVECNADWTVSLENTSWAVVEQSSSRAGKGGTFTVSFDLNNSDSERKGTVVVKSGKLEKKVQFTQGSRSGFFSPATLTLYGTASGSVAFDAPASWTATVTAGEEWLTLSTASGNKGASTLSCVAKDENPNQARREATVRLRINGGVLDLSVVQAAKGEEPPGPGPGETDGQTYGFFGIDGANYILGEGGWNQSSRVVLSDGGRQYILMNRAATELICVLDYNPSATVGSVQQVQVVRMNKTAALHNRLYQVQVSENTDTYLKLRNSESIYFIIQK